MLPRAKLTRVDNAYVRLKADILNGGLPPGYQAPEPDFAERLQMSRTPVREALIRLEADGLIDLVPRRGARVLSVTTQDFFEIHQILSVLEGLAASIVSQRQIPEHSFEEMEAEIKGAEDALQAGDLEGFAGHDDRFHRLVGEASNRRLHHEIDRHLNQVYRANLVLLRMNKGPALLPMGNRDLFETLRSANMDKAEAAARMHRMEGMATMKGLFEDSGLTHL
ncbi:MAG: GntR family transcriptional regulator [Roseibium sp.]